MIALRTDRSGRLPIERIADHIDRHQDGAFDPRQRELPIPDNTKDRPCAHV